MDLHPMGEAPRDGRAIVIVTPRAAHRAEWDGQFSNFWSLTQAVALSDDEMLGWLSAEEWTALVLPNRKD